MEIEGIMCTGKVIKQNLRGDRSLRNDKPKNEYLGAESSPKMPFQDVTLGTRP